jgi:serine/threonine protein kinase
VEPPPFEPVQFGRYFLEERLATGGMAEIFRAKSRGAHGFEKTLAVKRILPHLASNPEFVEMFIDEAKVMVRINHPKVVQVLDFGEEDGQYFIAMEYVKGIDGLALLRLCVQRGLRPSTAIAVHIVAEVLDGLQYAHTLQGEDGASLGIIHRDISPSNIFISDQGEVKLGDFGIARAAMRTGKTESENLKGKYGYLSPEVVAPDGQVDQRSDLFSVGVVLAELLMVRRLFVGKSDVDVLLQVRDAKLDRLDRFGQHIAPDLRRVLESALTRDPDSRYQDAATFRDALHRYLYDHRSMVRHTDVRRFLKRLRGEPETDDTYNVVKTAPPPPAREAPAPPPKAAAGDAPPAAPPTSQQAETPVRHSPPSRELLEAPPPKKPKKPRSSPTYRSISDRAPVVHRSKPVASTEYSTATRERIEIRPLRKAGSSDSPGRTWRPEAERGPVADGELVTATAVGPLEELAGAGRHSLEELAAADEVGSDAPRVIGHKRKIAIGPPPKPRPVPSTRQTDEVLELDDAGVVDALPEIDRLGTDSGWDHSASASVEPVLPEFNVDMSSMDAKEVAAGRVITSPSAQYPRVRALAEARQKGNLADESLVSVLFGLAVKEETGLLVLQGEIEIKEIFLINGDPYYVVSNRPDDLFGQYLLKKGEISEGELAMALAMLPHFEGKLGQALVHLKLFKPVQILRHLTQQAREKMMDAFGWDEGTYAFLRETEYSQESAPLGLNAFELISAGITELPLATLKRRMRPHLDRRLRAVSQPAVPPEIFRMGNQPREVFDVLDGKLTVAELLDRFDDVLVEDAFNRVLYLLIETGLAR